MHKLSAIIIGLGNQSINDHIPSLIANKDVRIVGVCDPNPLARVAFVEAFPKLNGVVTTDNVDQLLGEVNPDIAIIAVPHNQYFDIVTKLCENHVYFLKEKPLARDLAEMTAILDIPGFKNYGFITTQRRYSKLYKRANEMLQSLGNIYMFNAVYMLNIDSPQHGWRGRKSSAGGGCIIDMGYHIIDQLIWWLGVPETIHAKTSATAVPGIKYDAEDSATITFQYNTSLHGTILLSRAGGEKRETYEIYGSKAYMVGSKYSVAVYDRFNGELIAEMSHDKSDEMLENQLNFFINRVSNSVGFEDIQQNHIENMIFIERCYEDAVPHKKRVLEDKL